ncbi:MAG: ATP-binding protein [Vicinamibacterales bacterium]
MRGLALKIFLSYWATQIAVIAAFAYLPDRGGSLRLADHILHDGMVAARLLESSGAATCDAYADAVEASIAFRLQLQDADGARVCGVRGAVDAKPYERYTVETGGQRYIAAGIPLPAFAVSGVTPSFPWGNVLFAVLVSGIVCFALARYLASPLREVRDVSYRLAAGDLQARAGPAVGVRRDEIGELVRDFDTMAARIEALVHSQSQLLSDISHELRSPLARLNVALELARRKAGPEARADLDRLEAEAARMNQLIGRVLALARAESPEAARPFEPVEMIDVLSVVTDNAEYEAREQHKRVRFDAEARPSVLGDPELLASAVDNVVRNAVRYTAEGTTVDVRLLEQGGDAVVIVRDRGPGVPPAELERIFTPFHRVDAGRHRDAGGHGLGLAIARRAVALHKGTITAAPADGGGLEVLIRLPRLAVPQPVH